MSEPPLKEEYNQLADFTHRPFRPDLEPHWSPKGITLGPMDPKKVAALLGKVAAKSKGAKGKSVKPTIAHGKK